jgi:hypothetical protein
MFVFAQTGLAQNATNQLTLSNNYFVTGDYVVGGVGLRGLGINGLATGTITIPDANSIPATGLPPGADVVAAFLYWVTVEKSQSAFAGQQGFFNGYAITGSILGNPNAPTSWSSGGCSGSSSGTTTMRAYRADVRPFLNLDANGMILGNGSYQVKLADSGSSGGGTPLTLGASLVIIYRVLSPAVPLNSIVIYDGAAAPSNSSSTMSQTIQGFYQAAASSAAKITHIVGNGKPNKSESVLLNSVNLPSLYPGLPPFPGVYNQNTISPTGGGSWDNPTWIANAYGAAVNANDAMETTFVVPNGSGSGCADWGAVIFSTPVQDTDGDGLLDVWEDNQGYTDAISGQFVALPGANKLVKDIFLETDYLSNVDGGAGAYLHSHLPRQAALDMVGDSFAKQNVHLHFDVGPTNYLGNCSTTNPAACPDPYIVQGGTGGNAISESATVCTDSTTLCQYPGTPSVGWKEGLLFIRNNARLPGNTSVPMGDFQFGRKDSYHYLLFGHSLGSPRSYWTSFAATLSSTAFAKLISVVNSGSAATVTLQSPPPSGPVKPGDCPNTSIPACNDSNVDRVTVAGALGQPALNGTYRFTNLNSSIDGNNVTTTTFTIATTGVANGTYNFGNESRLQLMYLGPTSSSGHSDLGGGDSMVTFGLWGADDPTTSPLCQGDPSKALQAGQIYCDNQQGTLLQQAGTLMHELGHTLTLTHGGVYYNNASTPYVASYDANCKPNFLSIMSYLFQVRGFPDGGIDYSGQTLQPLDETELNETVGIGSDIFTALPAAHSTRWYAPPNALDTKVGRFATLHCDGTPIGPNEPPAVRVDGSAIPTPMIDWNNNFTLPDLTEPVAWQDVNFIGSTLSAPAAPFQGFNDWMNVDPRQIGARENALGFSGGTGAGAKPQAIGGGATAQAIGGGALAQAIGGGANAQAIGGGAKAQAIGGGAMAQAVGGGTELDRDTAYSSADPPAALTAVQNGDSIVLNWTAPAGQVRTYDIWRALGSFPTPASVLANYALFADIHTLPGTPPPPTFTDTNLGGNTYTYFVTASNQQAAQSGPSFPSVVNTVLPLTVKANPASMAYGGSVPTLTVSYSGFVNGDTASSLSGTLVCTTTATTSSAVGAYPITCSGQTSTNYIVTFLPGTLTIKAMALTITAGSASINYGTAVPAITASYGGFVAGNTAANLTPGPTCTTAATSTSAVGTYASSCSGAADANYVIGYVNGAVAIIKAATATVITSNSPNPSVVGSPVAVSFKVAGSGMPTGSVTVTASTGETCNGLLTSGAGSCSITFTTSGSRTLTASYTGDSNFLGGTSAGVAQTQLVGDFFITATPSSQTISSGHQANYAITVTPISGLTGAVALSCAGAPPNSTCAISPSTTSLQGSPVMSTVTLSANKNVNHGTFTLTITATFGGGILTRSTAVNLIVK